MQDNRFTHITDCKILDLYRKIPKCFGGWKIDISYKNTEDDIFSGHKSIEIDQLNFGKELLEFIENKSSDKDSRLYYAHGMTDIDIFKIKNEYCIYYSVYDGSYVYFYFKSEEFKKLASWLTLEYGDK